MTIAEKYADDLISGKVVSGQLMIKSAKRFKKDLKRKDLVFDAEAAEKALNFIEKYLRHWEGSWRGQPLLLEPWQKFIVYQIFGWKKKDGRRRVRSVYIQVARKNGKTSFAAAILLYHIFADSENTPQILVGANNEDQAKICVNSAGRILQQSPEFHELLDDEDVKLSIYGRNVIGIYYKDRDGSVKAMSKNPDTQDGFNPSLGIIDEYHEAKDDALLNVIESGQGARPQPLLFVVTTAGFLKSGPCFAKLRRMSVDILNGKSKDDSHMAFIFEQDKDDDWKDSKVWKKSNPNLGVSVFEDYLETRLVKALNEGASKEVDFKTKNLNMWVDAPEVWIPDDVYMKNSHGITPDMLLGRPCWAGLDLSSGIDINAYVLYFPKDDQIPFNCFLSYFWIPSDNVRENKINMDYSDFVKDGFIFTTPGNIIEHEMITDFIIRDSSKYKLQTIGFDARMAYHGTIQQLLNAGIDCQPFGQGMMNVTEPTKDLEKMVYEGVMEHFKNPVMRWMNGNITLRRDSIDNYMIDKGKSQGKIDGFAALINAIGTNKRFPQVESVYKYRGVQVI
jgi:phage terminase large subunit-like protein